MTIITPYRDRIDNLRQFLPCMINFFGDSPIEILIVEQMDNRPFNRGALLNAGFLLAPASDYVVFHDVDLLPLDRSCEYSKPSTGLCHLAGHAEQFGYALPYVNYCGGVLIASRHAFHLVNGYSNRYWGWGCEDDDLLARAWSENITIERRPGLYRSLPHRMAPNSEGHRNQVLFANVLRQYVQSELGLPIHPRVFRRVPLTLLKPNLQEVQTHRVDGLSTIAFSVHSQVSLNSYLRDSSIPVHHRIAKIVLEMAENSSS